MSRRKRENEDVNIKNVIRISEQAGDLLEAELELLPPSCCPVSIAADERTNLSSLPLIKEAIIEALHTSLTSTNIPDPTALTEQSGVSLSVLADAIVEDAKQITRIIPNLTADVDSLNAVIKNSEIRGENILEITEGATQSTEENTDFDSELREAKIMSRSLDKALHKILTFGFPDLKHDIKSTIEECMLMKDKEDGPYTNITSDISCEAMCLLNVAGVIVADDDDDDYETRFRILGA